MNGKVIVRGQKFDIINKKDSKPSVSAVMFCKRCLAYTVHIDWCYHAIINIQVSLKTLNIIIISVLTTSPI